MFAFPTLVLAPALIGGGVAACRAGAGRKFRHPRQAFVFAPLRTTLTLLLDSLFAWGLVSTLVGVLVPIVSWLFFPMDLAVQPLISLTCASSASLVAFWLVSVAIHSHCTRVTPLPDPPLLRTGDPVVDDGFSEVYRLLELNLMPPVGKLECRWASPGPKYPGAYLWDSAFISLAWKLWDPTVSNEILRPLLDFQVGNESGEQERGRVPQMVFMGRIASPISNPPLLAWALAEVYPYARDADALGDAFPKLREYQDWLLRCRSRGGLFSWVHSYESGLDNSPRFTDASEKEKEDIGDLGVVDLASFAVLQARSLGVLADLIGLKDEAHSQRELAAELAQVARERHWDPGAGLFLDVKRSTGERPGINTVASFFPLAAGIPDPRQEGRLVHHLLDPAEYNTRVPFPTVARDDPRFMKDTWRGPVWLNTAYLCLLGLSRCTGEPAGPLLGDMAWRLVEGVYETFRNCGSFYEFYDPDRHDLEELTRKKGNFWKRVTLGGKPVPKFVGWTGLVNTLLVEFVLGLKRTLTGSSVSVELAPHLPGRWRGRELELELPALGDCLRLELSDGDLVRYHYENESLGVSRDGRLRNQARVTLFREGGGSRGPGGAPR
ncbi:MAG: MGH1-like glycoside hydrolase domain-containing protein [Promethearchaeota archaeon]